MKIEIHVWSEGDRFGVNAKRGEQWLEHDDLFDCFMQAWGYAYRLCKRIGGAAIYINGR